MISASFCQVRFFFVTTGSGEVATNRRTAGLGATPVRAGTGAGASTAGVALFCGKLKALLVGSEIIDPSMNAEMRHKGTKNFVVLIGLTLLTLLLDAPLLSFVRNNNSNHLNRLGLC
jgi:hypothetical protein